MILLYLCLDALLIGRYTTAAAISTSQRKHYGTVKLVVHYLAAVATIAVGVAAMVLQVRPLLQLPCSLHSNPSSSSSASCLAAAL